MTDDPGVDDYAKVTGEENAKLLSLAQDIIYVSHASRKPTPKHLALSMTICQMTGSSGLLKIIHGFWHCASRGSRYALVASC
jgi:Rieske Fe-S protein